jgi:hypothetical protein
VGQSRQKGGVAYWSLINTKDKSYLLKETPYNTKKLINEVKDIDSENEYLSSVLTR